MRFIPGDIVTCEGKDFRFIVLPFEDQLVSVPVCPILVYVGQNVKRLLLRYIENPLQFSGQQLDGIGFDKLTMVKVYDPQEEDFICCGSEMSTAGLTLCNGWECSICGHQELDVASAKMAGGLEDVLQTEYVTREYTYWLPGDPRPNEWPMFYQWQCGSDIWRNAHGHPRGWHSENGTRRRWQEKLQTKDPKEFKSIWMQERRQHA